MVHWTAEERAAIALIWSTIDLENDGHDALGRLLFVYPWTQRYFSDFGDVSTPDAVAGNVKVHEHGKKVIAAIDNVIHHLDDIKKILADLSKKHAVEFNVDPENFKRFGDMLLIVLATKATEDFTPKVEAAWEKFMNALVAALTHGYY